MLGREVEERTRAEGALARTLEVERELKDQLRHQAFHDPLTDLANRTRFMDRLEHALQRATRKAEGVAVLFIDLDDFKSVNDSLGHPAGDQLLIGVAARLQACLRPGDTAARLGGDEFAILLEELIDADHADHASPQRVIDALRVPMVLSGTEVFVRGSIGIAVSDAISTADELLRRADVAMYAAKADGKGQFAIYDIDMETSMVGHLQLAGELQRAVERGELVVHYQPSVVLSSQKIAGVEALVRWQHPHARPRARRRSSCPSPRRPASSCRSASWVLQRGVPRRRASWQLEYPSDPPLSVAVNVSARQVHQPGLVEIVAEALRDSGLPPDSLVLEITESLVMQNAELAITRLHELKALGVRLAIDDFGTGYSSLSYLRRFPVDILKIDKSFVDGVGQHGKERELAQSIIDLGQTLNLEIVAEGVERADQLGWLKSRNCDTAQGFLFAHALDADAISTLLGDTAGGAMPPNSPPSRPAPLPPPTPRFPLPTSNLLSSPQCTSATSRSPTSATTRSRNSTSQPGPVLLLGPNAQGKTNLLEAVFLLATGRSERADADADYIAWPARDDMQPHARIAGAAVRASADGQRRDRRPRPRRRARASSPPSASSSTACRSARPTSSAPSPPSSSPPTTWSSSAAPPPAAAATSTSCSRRSTTTTCARSSATRR